MGEGAGVGREIFNLSYIPVSSLQFFFSHEEEEQDKTSTL